MSVFNTTCNTDCPGKKAEWRSWEPLNPLDPFSVPSSGWAETAKAIVSPFRWSVADWDQAAAGEHILFRRVPCKAA